MLIFILFHFYFTCAHVHAKVYMGLYINVCYKKGVGGTRQKKESEVMEETEWGNENNHNKVGKFNLLLQPWKYLQT